MCDEAISWSLVGLRCLSRLRLWLLAESATCRGHDACSGSGRARKAGLSRCACHKGRTRRSNRPCWRGRSLSPSTRTRVESVLTHLSEGTNPGPDRRRETAGTNAGAASSRLWTSLRQQQVSHHRSMRNAGVYERFAGHVKPGSLVKAYGMGLSRPAVELSPLQYFRLSNVAGVTPLAASK